jgi:nitrogenase molybdenum-cofactor synthesis protein NifE
MLVDKVQEVFNEPGCATNQDKSAKERKKGCTKSLKPGAVSWSLKTGQMAWLWL